VRQSIEKMLTFYGFEVHAFENPDDFLAHEFLEVPAVVITDMRLPNKSGVELQAEVLARGRNIPFVFVSGEATLNQGLTAMKQGALEFLTKPFDSDDLIKAVVRGIEQEMILVKSRAMHKDQEKCLESLTKREREVYDLLLQSYKNSELAEVTGLSINTIKVYKTKVMQKMRVNTIAELIRQKT
jgi:FixJ family two-component response regulator